MLESRVICKATNTRATGHSRRRDVKKVITRHVVAVVAGLLQGGVGLLRVVVGVVSGVLGVLGRAAVRVGGVADVVGVLGGLGHGVGQVGADVEASSRRKRGVGCTSSSRVRENGESVS